jgi:membrane protein implicated in regulation of membrane protease activity
MDIGWFKNRTFIAQTIFIVIILYAVSSIVVLGVAAGVFHKMPGAYLNPYICVAYAIISFALTAFISAYHLSTMIRRKKRRCDRLDDGLKVCKKELVHG